MKPIQSAILIFLTFCASTLFANSEKPEIILRGVLDSGATQVFSLSTLDGQSSSWVKLNQKYKGYLLAAYDSESKKLTLTKDEKTYELTMAAARSAAAPETGDESAEDEESAEELTKRLETAEAMMKLMNVEEMVGKIVAAQQKARRDMVRSQMESRPNFNEERFNERMQAMDDAFKNTDWSPVEEKLTEAYAELFSQEELEAISSFYSTSAGQATLEKAPEMQQRMTEAMMPIIMETHRQTREMMGGGRGRGQGEPKE